MSHEHIHGRNESLWLPINRQIMLIFCSIWWESALKGTDFQTNGTEIQTNGTEFQYQDRNFEKKNHQEETL